MVGFEILQRHRATAADFAEFAGRLGMAATRSADAGVGLPARREQKANVALVWQKIGRSASRIHRFGNERS